MTNLYENEIISINPLYPPILGGLFEAGGHPQTPGRKYPAPLSQQSLYVRYAIDCFVPRQIGVLAMMVLFQIPNPDVSDYLFI